MRKKTPSISKLRNALYTGQRITASDGVHRFGFGTKDSFRAAISTLRLDWLVPIVRERNSRGTSTYRHRDR